MIHTVFVILAFNKYYYYKRKSHFAQLLMYYYHRSNCPATLHGLWDCKNKARSFLFLARHCKRYTKPGLSLFC